MKRTEFSKKIVFLLQEMIDAGDSPIIDYVKRSDMGQYFMFLTGKSKCNGVNNPSRHQSGKAMDIYFVGAKGTLIYDKKLYKKWHKYWGKLGGKPMIKWDMPHFE